MRRPPTATEVRGVLIALKLADDLQHGERRARTLTVDQQLALRAADAWARSARNEFPSLSTPEKIK